MHILLYQDTFSLALLVVVGKGIKRFIEQNNQVNSHAQLTTLGGTAINGDQEEFNSNIRGDHNHFLRHQEL